MKGRTPSINSYSPDEALALIYNNDINVNAYNNHRDGALHHGVDMYPSYHKVLEVKRETYPLDIKICENECSVSLQNLLNHTCRRLRMTLDMKIVSNVKDLILMSKYGMDGSTGLSTFKHQNSSELDKSTVFSITLIPLRLMGTCKDSKNRKYCGTITTHHQ